MKKYEFIEHTADIRIRVKGDDLKDLFKNTAEAMFEIIAQKSEVSPSTTLGTDAEQSRSARSQKSEEINIKLKSDNDIEELFINWLNELLSLSAIKELIFHNFKINKLDKSILQAAVKGSDIKNYKVNTEIKAATYHELKLEKTASGWQAEVIFDV